ncbi:DUF4019 domain-containing protein [Massilia sp. IC2-477]|uniref:DUF4019 domain-containing protein n=1 Tax=unclassified Massilia TaxID=2609279 RepID=UPI001D12AD1C|nr:MULTISPECIES: DUF4019 domain-containing protein [unclassified Massilia]MCC2955308.1 DUF4019 domain-containing protein [Massilia sp. IC2-477]MCC2972547.1 DUF4019 domain-containing protein [Massilia sp. IC2-476]
MIAAVLAVCCLSAAPAHAQEGRVITAAHGAAQEWLKLVDAENYAAAYEASANEVRAKTPKFAWNMLLSAVHLPLGQLRARKLVTTAPEAGGKRVKFEFDSQFEKDKQVRENVTTVLDQDGKWRVTGYTVASD